mgnify:CR=1 FL=1
MEFDQKIFCENLVRMRKEKGYSKYEMSIQADIHYTYYLDIENGKFIPNFRRLISIANALNTDIAHLLGQKKYSKTDSLKNEIFSKLIKINDENFLLSLFNILIYIRLWSDTDL